MEITLCEMVKLFLNRMVGRIKSSFTCIRNQILYCLTIDEETRLRLE